MHGKALCLSGSISVCYVCIRSSAWFLVPTTSSSRTDASFSGQFILDGVVSDLVFRTTIRNGGPNTAYSLVLRFTHPTALAYSRVEGGAQFTCETDQSRTVTSCTVTNALASDRQVGLPDSHSMESLSVCVWPYLASTYPFSISLFLHVYLLNAPLHCSPPSHSLCVSSPPRTHTLTSDGSSRTLCHP